MRSSLIQTISFAAILATAGALISYVAGQEADLLLALEWVKDVVIFSLLGVAIDEIFNYLGY